MLVPTILAVIAAASCLNAFRGGRIIDDEKLPGRNLYFAAPGLALTAGLAAWDPLLGLGWGAAFLFWGAFSWGHLFGLGLWKPQDRTPKGLEALLLKLPGNFLPMVGRELFVLPGLALIAWLTGKWWLVSMAPAYAALAVGVRWVAYQAAGPVSDRPLDWPGVKWAEFAIGGILWGAMILLSLYGLPL